MRCLNRICVLLALATLTAQAQKQPATTDKPFEVSPLDATLARLDANIQEFNQTIPSFFAREEISEGSKANDERPSRIALHSSDPSKISTFVVRRAGDPDDMDDPAKDRSDPTQANSLHESRITRVIDNKGFRPMEDINQSDKSSRAYLPFNIFGIYSGASTRISMAAKTCFRYRYHPALAGDDSSRIVIEFHSWPRKDRGHNCPYGDNISGRGYIDPHSMRLVRLEDTEADGQGRWNWSVDYSPVLMDGKTFWLPTTIRSEAITVVPSVHTDKTVTYSLTATYSRYRQAVKPPAAK